MRKKRNFLFFEILKKGFLGPFSLSSLSVSELQSTPFDLGIEILKNWIFRVIFGVLFHYYLIILYLLATSFGSQSLAYSIDTSLLII